ncbi:family 16 glycosylhydrolase [Leptobacterium flavescens]|uniref:Family 16 glycosylhydrolase n=1 Tax=Leptobacterium flavescens TaxID=472055 RepID=A0A6P0UXA9_9FLAO|nr:glycoside hydrolase family 16 protein [Leptobacterium flavescens]NER15333.1 family 16 glycosylhydrolase [Leptobacterium flavescens]
MKKIKHFIVVFILLTVSACQEDDADFGTVTVPTNLRAEAIIADDQSGNVTVTPTADNALNFHVFFQQGGDPVVASPGESVSFRYTQSGQYSVVVTIVAFGTGGAASSINITLDLDVRLFIDTETLQLIGGDGTKRWVWNQTESGHFGVGDPNADFPNFFSAAPDQLDPCLYDDVLVFNYDDNDNYTFQLETGNNNETFINWAEVNRFFPNASPQQFVDECRDITDQIATNTSFVIIPEEGGRRTLDVENSTLSYWSGAMEYEIVELTADRLTVRGLQTPFLGGGLLAWYHTFIPEGSTPGGGGGSAFENLVWEDNFDVNGAPDTANWDYDLGTGDNGWGNGEEQYYTDRPDNVIIEDGILKITAKRENFNGSQFTSSRIKTQDRFEFQYGRVEGRIKLPTGGGTWPAFWMLGADFETNIWPGAGEIDIMEHVGNQQNTIFGSTHDPNNFGGNARTGTTTVSDASTEFHVYAVEWNETDIRFFVDDQLYFTASNNGSLPFNKDFFIILNVAMGGNFGGVIDGGFTESVMEVDYIRIYQ